MARDISDGHLLRRFAQALLWMSLCCSGCATTVSSDWQSRLSTCPTSEELGQFRPWDRIEIRVFGQPDLSGEYEVSPRGTISFPILGELEVEGKRCDDLEIIVREGLQEAYLRDPSVVSSKSMSGVPEACSSAFVLELERGLRGNMFTSPESAWLTTSSAAFSALCSSSIASAAMSSPMSRSTSDSMPLGARTT